MPRIALDRSFSALQRAEIAEISVERFIRHSNRLRFSALQRAEIAEIRAQVRARGDAVGVSVLFNEPKLLKLVSISSAARWSSSFQCSSTSRNC